MFGLKLPTIVTLVLALGATTLAIDRFLENRMDDMTRSEKPWPTPSTVTAVRPNHDQAYEPPSDPDILAQSEQPAAGPFNAAPILPKRASHKPQDTPKPLVSIEDGRLSVKAQAAPLKTLLTATSDKSGIPILYDALNPQSISIAFKDLPLDEGLRRILTEQDIFLSYGAGGSDHALTGVWVYPKGQGSAMQPAPPEHWAATVEFEQDLSTNPHWGARTRAIEALIERKAYKSRDAVLYALSDPNHNVRFSALSGALDIGMRLPAGTLENLMQHDPSPYVRSLALQAIGADPKADKLAVRRMAQAALNDPSPGVQEEARDVLDALDPNDWSKKARRYR